MSGWNILFGFGNEMEFWGLCMHNLNKTQKLINCSSHGKTVNAIALYLAHLIGRYIHIGHELTEQVK